MGEELELPNADQHQPGGHGGGGQRTVYGYNDSPRAQAPQEGVEAMSVQCEGSASW